MSLDGISDGERFGVLAIDHRDSLRAVLAPNDPDSVSSADITSLKRELVSTLAGGATGVMLEPEYSIPELLDGTLPAGVGFTAALEAQGYGADPEAAATQIVEGWSVEAAADSGASAAKLLVFYRPDRPGHAAAQERVAAEILAECRRVGIPLVLEPLFYGLEDPGLRGHGYRSAEAAVPGGPGPRARPPGVGRGVCRDHGWLSHAVDASVGRR